MSRPSVLCTIVKTIGSAPQAVGAKMRVSASDFSGTLGGGELERRVLEEARRKLSRGGEPELKEFVLCKELGQCCGGRVSVFFDPAPLEKTVHVFGGGHVGRALASVLDGTDLKLRVIDPREEWTRLEDFPRSVSLHREDPIAYVERTKWDERDGACVMTYSHDLDFEVILRLLKQPLGYLGLIGSTHKAAVFQSRLKGLPNDGADWDELWDKRMSCPIGIPLKSKNPKIVAVSAAAELLGKWALSHDEPHQSLLLARGRTR